MKIGGGFEDGGDVRFMEGEWDGEKEEVCKEEMDL